MYQSTKLDVLIIGTGFSGVCMGIRLLDHGITNFRIVEKNRSIGGTWYENTYPGAACDVASRFYCFSFEPNPDWSRVYSPQKEILDYINRCVDKYKLRPHIDFGKKVVSCMLNQESATWITTFEDGETVTSHHVVGGNGGLHIPKVPDFKGKDLFEGTTMHSARWDHTYDFNGKRVAVIGSAASAVQIIPELAKQVDDLTVFQRTPNFVSPRYDRAYTEKEKARFRRWPWLNRLVHWFVFMRMDLLLYPIVAQKSKIGPKAADRIKAWMRSVIEDESLHPTFEPDYKMGCKRILVSDDYYATFNRDNVRITESAIDYFDQAEIVTADGVHHAVDAIVYATGFDLEAQFRSIEITGENGKTIAEAWADIPQAYRGVNVSGFPNYWTTTGPNTGVGTTSQVFMIEQSTQYIAKCIKMALANENTLMGAKPEAMAKYNDEIQAAFASTVWQSGCDSWYQREDGRIAILYPYNARTWRKAMRRVHVEDFEIKQIADHTLQPAIETNS